MYAVPELTPSCLLHMKQVTHDTEAGVTAILSYILLFNTLLGAWGNETHSNPRNSHY